jgi:ribonuclease P protein component
VLIAARNSCNELRIGVVAGVSIGKAVTRNYIKRRLRACLDELLPETKLGWDVIVMARPPIIQANYPEIRSSLVSLFERAGLLDQQN